MVLKKFGVISVGKILGCLYAILGIIVGAFMSLLAVLGFAASSGNAEAGAGALVFGLGAIIILPIFYGAIGFIGGIIFAALYNLVAGFTGGIEVELLQKNF